VFFNPAPPAAAAAAAEAHFPPKKKRKTYGVFFCPDQNDTKKPCVFRLEKKLTEKSENLKPAKRRNVKLFFLYNEFFYTNCRIF
jgi:hypothetical protein